MEVSLEKNEFNFLSQPSKVFNKDSLIEFSSIEQGNSMAHQNIYDIQAQQIKDNIDILKGMKKFKDFNRRKNSAKKEKSKQFLLGKK